MCRKLNPSLFYKLCLILQGFGKNCVELKRGVLLIYEDEIDHNDNYHDILL